MPVIATSDQNVQFNGLALTLREISGEIFGEFCCELCLDRCSGPTYVCRRLGVFHKSCISLPEQTSEKQPHPHTLSLNQLTRAEWCNFCEGECRRFAYSCHSCGTNMDARCAFSAPTIDWSDHIHPLTVVSVDRNMSGRVPKVKARDFWYWRSFDDLRCKSCEQKGCFVEECSLIRWESCEDYVLHLQCGPLPCTIKHSSHVHPLILMNYVIDENSDDFCCHVCEEYRDPYLCVYYCLDCPFIAEVGCVISEVAAALKGQRGNVKLRTVGRKGKCKLIGTDSNAEEIGGDDAGKRGLSLRDLIDSIDESDRDQWRTIIGSVGMANTSVDPASTETEGSANPLSPSYLEAGYKILKADHVPDFVVQLDHISKFFDDYDEEEFIVRGSYFVAKTLIPSFENLLLRYGDFGAGSELSPVVKSLCLLASLDYLQKLRRSSLEDEKDTELDTEPEAPEVNPYMKLAEYAGFHCKFMEDCIDHAGRTRSICRIENRISRANLDCEDKLWRISEKRAMLDEQEEEAKRRFEEATASAARAAEEDGIGDDFSLRLQNMGRGFYLK